jgi:hypothetical protein|tara:strand:- start:7675 stop:7785 length:111 start_codon:yes stop_codon:yes gene_type:complete
VRGVDPHTGIRKDELKRRSKGNEKGETKMFEVQEDG